MPSLYIGVFIMLALSTLFVCIKPSTDKVLYYICFTVLTIFIALRYGQGTDYVGYLEIYHKAKVALDPNYGISIYIQRTGSEIGWKLIMLMLNHLNISFQVFVIMISLLMMFFTHKFICEYCNCGYKTIALTLLYPTVYLTYYFSGWRQGIVMALFFGVLLKYIFEKKYLCYVVGVALLCSIHKSSLVYFVVPLIVLMKDKWIKYSYGVCILCSGLMVFESVRTLIYRSSLLLGAGADYFGASTVNINWLSLLEKVVMLGLVLLLWFAKDCQNEEERLKAILKIYSFNLVVYMLLMTSPTGAGRLAIMFKMAEVILIPMLLCYAKVNIRRGIIIAIVMISTVMSYKNIAYYSEGYFKEVNAWNYPYVTIFNQKDILLYRGEAIRKYSDIPHDFYESHYMWD